MIADQMLLAPGLHRSAAEGSSAVRSSGGWPTSLGQGPSFLGHPPRPVEGSAQEQLDVGIKATEFIGRPLGQGIVDSRVNPQQYLLAVTHCQE